MEKFAAVIKSLREWLLTFSIIEILMPFSLYIFVGSLGLEFLTDILSLFDLSLYWSLSDFLSAVVYLSWWIGFWLCLISPNIKYMPYALFAYSFILLFPFKYLHITLVISAVMWIFAGYWLLKYTALHNDDGQVLNNKVNG